MADDDNKPIKVDLINNDLGPRYVFTLRGMEAVQSGQTLTTEMNRAQLRSLDSEFVHDTDDVERWTVTRADGDHEESRDEGKALVDLPVAKLRKVAEAEGVALTNRGKAEDGTTDLPDLTKGADIAAAIQAKRDAAPQG